MGEKQTLFHSQQGLCWLCDKPMQLKMATWDHLLPVSKGGTWAPFNLKLAHRRCNCIRGHRDALDSREYVQAQLDRNCRPQSMYDRLYALLKREGVIP